MRKSAGYIGPSCDETQTRLIESFSQGFNHLVDLSAALEDLELAVALNVTPGFVDALDRHQAKLRGIAGEIAAGSERFVIELYVDKVAAMLPQLRTLALRVAAVCGQPN